MARGRVGTVKYFMLKLGRGCGSSVVVVKER